MNITNTTSPSFQSKIKMTEKSKAMVDDIYNIKDSAKRSSEINTLKNVLEVMKQQPDEIILEVGKFGIGGMQGAHSRYLVPFAKSNNGFFAQGRKDQSVVAFLAEKLGVKMQESKPAQGLFDASTSKQDVPTKEEILSYFA